MASRRSQNRTTMRYHQAGTSLDRHATHITAAFTTGLAPEPHILSRDIEICALAIGDPDLILAARGQAAPRRRHPGSTARDLLTSRGWT
jgi:hypothetical protein